MSFFFFNDTATTEIYTLSLHDALPICARPSTSSREPVAKGVDSRHGVTEVEGGGPTGAGRADLRRQDRKSTRLNSSHANISYAVFCLKKKTNTTARPMLKAYIHETHPH